MKWVVFATAPDQIMAEIWVQLVRSEGIPCRLQPGDTTNFLGVSATPVRLMTLETQAERAAEVLERGDEVEDDEVAARQGKSNSNLPGVKATAPQTVFPAQAGTQVHWRGYPPNRHPQLTRAYAGSRAKSAEISSNCPKAARRSSRISSAISSGGGRLAESSMLSSRSQTMSRFALSRLTRSS